MSVTLRLGRWRNEGQKVKVSLAYTGNLILEALFQNLPATAAETRIDFVTIHFAHSRALRRNRRPWWKMICVRTLHRGQKAWEPPELQVQAAVGSGKQL